MNKAILITGATSGIGKSLSKLCAKAGYEVIITGRRKEKAEKALEDIIQYSANKSVRLFTADLSTLKGIEDLAGEVKSVYNKLNVLVNNAGLSLPKREITPDGIEKTFAINHLGYFYLTELLLDLLKSSAPSRIINVASEAHSIIDYKDMMSEKKYNQYKVYGMTKTENIMFTYMLSEKLKGTGVTANCLHPGVVRTGIYDNVPMPARALINIMKPFFISPEKSAEYIFPLISDDKFSGITGKYFIKDREKESKNFTYDTAKQKELWKYTRDLITKRTTLK